MPPPAPTVAPTASITMLRITMANSMLPSKEK